MERPRITGNWDGWADPGGCSSNLFGDSSPLRGVPTLGRGLQRAIQPDEDKGRDLFEAERANERPIWIAVDEEAVGQRAEERLRSVSRCYTS